MKIKGIYMNPYEAVFKALTIVWTIMGVGVFIGWIIEKLNNIKRKK